MNQTDCSLLNLRNIW